MCAQKALFPGLRVAIFAGAPSIERYASVRGAFLRPYPQRGNAALYWRARRRRSAGESQLFASKFETSGIVEHGKGHCFPNTHALLEKSFDS